MTPPADVPAAALASFERGLAAVGRDDWRAATWELEEAFAAATHHPRVRSWYGLALVRGGSDRLRGVALCEAAVLRIETDADAELWWNLAQAYLELTYRGPALRALRETAARAPSLPGLGQAFARVGVRRRPVLSFLPRGNPLNKYLGLLRHRLFPPATETC